VFYRQNGGSFDASVQCTIPNEWQTIAPYNVGYTAGIETNKVAPEWIVKGNEMDKIITISKHSADVYKKTSWQAQNEQTGEVIPEFRLETEIEHVGFPRKEIETTEIELKLRHDFNFLAVAQLGPRKNIEGVINNFIDEFKNDDVGLLLKLNGANDSVIDYHNTAHMFQNITRTAKSENWKCSINFLHGNLTDEQMHGVYRHPKVKALVSLTHGEGFGLPIYEAAYNNLPVIATDWSGHLDFLTMKTGKSKRSKKMFANIKYELVKIPQSAIWNGVLHPESEWAEPSELDAKKKMRDVFKNYNKWLKKATTLSKTFKGSTHYYNAFNEALSLDNKREAEAL
jgi:glycosyltransferase involved in cell wall biosynthesis